MGNELTYDHALLIGSNLKIMLEKYLRFCTVKMSINPEGLHLEVYDLKLSLIRHRKQVRVARIDSVYEPDVLVFSVLDDQGYRLQSKIRAVNIFKWIVNYCIECDIDKAFKSNLLTFKELEDAIE